MTGTETLKVCVDKVLSPEKMLDAHEVALRERLGNAPDSSALAEVQRVISQITKDALGIPPGIPPGRPELGAAVLLSSKKWQVGRTITVGWMEGEYNENDRYRELIRYHAGKLERYMNLNFRFIGFNPDEADLRVADRRNAGSWSYIGTDNLLIPRDEPTMNFGWLTPDEPEEFARTVPHEFLHAAGLGHEHQNPKGGLPWNEPVVYADYAREQGWSREETYVQVIRRYATSMVVATMRDPASIMHYPVPARHLTDPSKAVGWNDRLSVGDRAFLRSIYPYPQTEAAVEEHAAAGAT